MYDLYMRDMLDYNDDIKVLTMNREYNHNHVCSQRFIYDYTDVRLQKLREMCNLDSLAGNGDDFSKMLRITLNMGSILDFGGPSRFNSFHAIEVIDKTKHGFKSNCLVAATVLCECFLSLGYISRVVKCLPIDLRFNECHCMTIAFVPYLKKFVAFDAGLGGCYLDSRGVPLGISEIRNNIIAGKEVHIRSTFNLDNERIMQYLCKNLVRFQSHKESKYGNESLSTSFFINLNPISLPFNDKYNTYPRNTNIFTYNDEFFWETNNNFNIIV